MSSHSSDVYIMEDSVESNSTVSPHLLDDDLVRSPSFTPTNSMERKEIGITHRKNRECILQNVGTNTEEQIEENVSNILYHSIIDLMQSVAGEGFLNHILLKTKRELTCDDVKETTATVQLVKDRIHKLSLPRLQNETKETLQSLEADTTGITPIPEWVTELQLSLSKTDNLLREITEISEKKSNINSAQISNPLISIPITTPIIKSYSIPPLKSSLPIHPDSEHIQKLEADIRKLKEKLAEMHVILAKEKVDSFIPLYNELLVLREAKQQTALRDVETTMAYLTTKEYCFRQQLATVEKRKRKIDININRQCCECNNGENLTSLAEDVERLEKLGQDLNNIRDEYQKRVILFDKTNRIPLSPHLGEKRIRTTSDDCFQNILEKELEKDQKLIMLGQELEICKKEKEEWQKRYEIAIQKINSPQDNPLFNSLLQDVEKIQSQEYKNKITLLCNLFGWKLLELTQNSVSIARIGSTEDEKLTLPILESSKTGRAAMATSIVLAKKILDGCIGLRGQDQKDNKDIEKENGEKNMDKTDHLEENEEVNNINEITEGIKSTINEDDCEISNVNIEEKELKEYDAESLQEENFKNEEENSLHLKMNPETQFFNEGLWEE